MADRDSFSEFLGIAKANFPYKMDELPDPKQFLLNMTNKTRKRRLKEDIIPISGSTAKIGPDYNACISDGLLKSLNSRHPGEGRDPELSDITGFRPSPE
jgi:hypothetical protein